MPWAPLVTQRETFTKVGALDVLQIAEEDVLKFLQKESTWVAPALKFKGRGPLTKGKVRAPASRRTWERF